MNTSNNTVQPALSNIRAMTFALGGIDGSEGCCVEVLGKFALGGIMAENAVGLVWIGAF